MDTSALYLTDGEAKELKVKIEKAGTIIFPKRGGAILTNKKRILKRDSYFDLNLMGVRPKYELLSNEYLWYWITKLDLSKLYDGSNVPQINNKDIEPLLFPLPPLPEQHRIVAKIEELFSELDKGVESLRTAQQQLKVYRQAVLKSAFEGKLTQEWRLLHPQPDAAELLDQIQTEREAQAKATGKKLKPIAPLTEADLTELPELPEGWEWTKVHSVAESCLGKMLDKEKNRGILKPYLRNINVRWGSFDLVDLLEMRFEENENERFGIKYGDLIVCEGGEPGRAAIWRDQVSDMKIQKALHRIRFIKLVKVDFFYYYLVFSASAKILDRYFTGTTIKHLTGESLNQFCFPICSLYEQNQIVQELESRLSVCDKLEETITQSLRKAEALRQSILKQAFEGKLVPQDPNDEPASVLLERIRSQREMDVPQSSKRGKRAQLPLQQTISFDNF